MATAAALGTLIALAVLAGPVAPAKAAGDGDIRLVDFHGFTYPVPTGEIAERVRLRNGRRAGNAAGRCDVRLQSVSYGRLADVDGEVAAVTLAFNCGGTGNPSGGYLFRMERGRPRVVGEIAWGDRATGGYSPWPSTPENWWSSGATATRRAAPTGCSPNATRSGPTA